jgi:hypothetical protein
VRFSTVSPPNVTPRNGTIRPSALAVVAVERQSASALRTVR